MRSLAFNIIFAFYTIILLTIATPFLLLPLSVGRILTHSWAYVVFGALRSVVGLDLRVTGLEKIQFPCLIACKHQSTWETIVFHLLFPHVCYVLKEELNRFTLKWYFTRLKMIVVDRKKGHKSLVDMIHKARDVIKEDRPIVIFPEGTRSKPGEKGHYHKGIASLYKALQVPVYPAALNSGYFWGRRSFDKKPGIVDLHFLDPIEPGLTTDDFMRLLESRLEDACQKLPAPTFEGKSKKKTPLET